MPVCRAIRMQQQQTVVAQPMYVSQSYVTASVIDSYPHLKSYFIGALLIIAGALGIIFGIVETVIISQHYFGGAGYALICGVLVSIVLVQSMSGGVTVRQREITGPTSGATLNRVARCADFNRTVWFFM